MLVTGRSTPNSSDPSILEGNMKNLAKAISVTFSDIIYIAVAVSFSVNFLAIDYIILSQSTTFRIMAAQNTPLFNWSTLGLSVITAILFGVSIAMLIYGFRARKAGQGEAGPSTLAGMIVATIASGCPVCGAWLLPLLGIAGSLAVFPFQGLELRVLAVLLLGFSINRSAKMILGICPPRRRIRRVLTSTAIVSVVVATLFLLPYVPDQYKFKFQQNGVVAPTATEIALGEKLNSLAAQVNPDEGFAINVNFGNMGYRLVRDGVIDFDKFSALYARAGTPLTPEQLRIFSANGLDMPITITRDNAYFLLNLFWAFGLANENPILTEGQIATYGGARLGDFASTGGWSIARKPLEAFFAKDQLAPMTDLQQARLLRVAQNVYRPCCGNSTAFPDCNHGMALLGVLELMASNGASEDELFTAAKYFSAFWFPSQALDVAAYFAATQDKNFTDVDPKLAVSEQYFSGRGWSRVKGWLDANLGQTQQSAQQGGGCGV
jgi:hypothetical protein